MSIDKKILDALDLKNLAFPTSLKVLSLEAEDYTDSTGEPSLRILAILDESTEISPGIGHDVGELKSIIRESLRKRGITTFPYIFLAKPSELQAADDEH